MNKLDRLRYASFQPAFQAKRIMEKIENDDHVYVDIDITFDDSRESFELSSPATYRTTKTEAIDPETVKLFEIPRISVEDDQGSYESLSKASGAWHRAKRLIRA